jgi:Protein of unknown function (DUF742)
VTGSRRRSGRVRPYTLTQGRTISRRPLLLETLISVPDYDPAVERGLFAESREIYRLCRNTRSIIEISAELVIPLGVIRVLVGDMADNGLLWVHPTAPGASMPDQELLERVLVGLQTINR